MRAESASSQKFIAQTAKTVFKVLSGTVENSVLVPSNTSSAFSDTRATAVLVSVLV